MDLKTIVPEAVGALIGGVIALVIVLLSIKHDRSLTATESRSQHLVDSAQRLSTAVSTTLMATKNAAKAGDLERVIDALYGLRWSLAGGGPAFRRAGLLKFARSCVDVTHQLSNRLAGQIGYIQSYDMLDAGPEVPPEVVEEAPGYSQADVDQWRAEALSHQVNVLEVELMHQLDRLAEYDFCGDLEPFESPTYPELSPPHWLSR